MTAHQVAAQDVGLHAAALVLWRFLQRERALVAVVDAEAVVRYAVNAAALKAHAGAVERFAPNATPVDIARALAGRMKEQGWRWVRGTDLQTVC